MFHNVKYRIFYNEKSIKFLA
uniref:Uncharacterized protein n=1 Tax=Anguilla anguilla TaxID=7936 RepID=A0A0E9VRW2_ANGAN